MAHIIADVVRRLYKALHLIGPGVALPDSKGFQRMQPLYEEVPTESWLSRSSARRKDAGRACRVAASIIGPCLATGACASTDHESSPPQVIWTQAQLPDDFEPSLLTQGQGDEVLVASDGDAEGRQNPRLLQINEGSTRPVTVVTNSFYGRRTVWHGLEATGRQIYAFGGRSGGAHGITRWTVWSGTLDRTRRIVEDPQDFETFGGTKAGGLSGLVVSSEESPLLVGSRVSDGGGGLDIAIWRYAERQWVRRPSAGTSLAATDDEQSSAHGVTRRGDGVLVAGSVTQFGGGVRTWPATWTSPGSEGPWTQTLLPTAEEEMAEAQTASCDPDGRCLVVGYSGDELAAWTVSATGEAATVDLPDIKAGPSPIRLSVDFGAGSFAISVSDPAGGEGHILLGSGREWDQIEVPSGAIGDLLITDTSMWLTTSSPTGAVLWTAPAPNA